MDLKEAKPGQGRDVWILESETFKDPITLEIAYDDKDREFIEASKKVVEDQVREAWRILQKIDDKENERKTLISKYKEELQVKDNKIQELTKRLERSGKEKVQILQEANKLKETVKTQSEQLEATKEIMNEIKQKITKEPRVFSGQTFVSWNWYSVLTTANVPNGNYILSTYTKIIESNEYVENEEVEVGAYNLHVSDNLFAPEYELRGTTGLDMPTATIEWTFTLLPY